MIAPFQIAPGPRVRFGRGEAARTGEEAAALGMKRPLVLTDPGLAAAGVLGPVLSGLREAGADPCLYDGVEPNPGDASIVRAREAYEAGGCDGLIAAGGGSTMDTAKVAAALLAHGGAPRDFYGFGRAVRPGPALITVPTTAGTGSEVTRSAIVTDSERRIKAVVASDTLFARVAVVDPALLAGLPRPLAAGTMMDALTHAIESVGSPRACPWTDALAHEAIALIGRCGRAYAAGPADPEASGAVSLAATLAGRAFTHAGLGIVHSLAHPLGAYHDAHHGTVNGIFLAPVMTFNLPAMEEKYARMAPLLGAGREDAGAAIAAVATLARDVDIPASLRALGVTGEHLDAMARDAAESPQVATNPVPAGEEDMRRLYLALMD